jgi:MYXO-CTERM domain-containing protein
VAGVLVDGPGYATMFIVTAAGVALLAAVGPLGLRRRVAATTPG